MKVHRGPNDTRRRAAPARLTALQPTPVQRQSVYRTIVRERVAAPPQARVEYRVGTRIPAETQLYAVPQEVAVEVPAPEPRRLFVPFQFTFFGRGFAALAAGAGFSALQGPY